MKADTLHQKVDHLVDSDDIRVLYGVGVPLVAALVVIGVFLAVGEMWLMPAMMLVVFALTAVVTIGLNAMLSDSGDGDDES